MTLRGRLVLLTSVAVGLAIVGASVAAWVLIRSSLMDEVDQRLMERVPDADRIAAITIEVGSGEGPPAAVTLDRARMLLEDDPVGARLLDADGRVAAMIPPGEALTAELFGTVDPTPPDAGLRTVTVDGASYRVLTTVVSERDQVLQLLQPLSGVEATLSRIAWLLAAVAAVGVAMAGGLGWATVRAGLRPIGGLVAAAERVATTQDLGHRIAVAGSDRDDIVRLARSVNEMLAALDAARAQQRELIENAGHELRTPLAVLRNDVGVLLRSEQRPDRRLSTEDRNRLLADLDAEAAALSDLVAEVIDLARGDAEPEPPVEADLSAVVERAVARSRRVNPTVNVDVHVDDVAAVVRPVALERAVANLVRNAVQVSADHAVVAVTLERVDGAVCIRVDDRGPGIAESDLPHLFDRFYRGEGARERHGSGLGLAIVAQVAELHGGTVTAANRADGGATFTVQLPQRRWPDSDGDPDEMAKS